jgi:hypothetical protein
VAHVLPPLEAEWKEEATMKIHNKRRAVYVLFVMGSVLLLAGAWNFSEEPYMQSREARAA